MAPGLSTGKWIDDAHAGVDEISAVARGDRQTVGKRRSRDETVLHRHGLAGSSEICDQFRPRQASILVPRQTVELSDSGVEPAFQRCPLSALGQDENPESQFSQDHRVDSDLRLMNAKPLDYSQVGGWFRRLTEDVGINQIPHRASVDSESMAAKKPFSGQARSQSTAPWFCGAGRTSAPSSSVR